MCLAGPYNASRLRLIKEVQSSHIASTANNAKAYTGTNESARLVGSGGSDPTAASGGVRKGSEWPRSARSKLALSSDASAGYRNRSVALIAGAIHSTPPGGFFASFLAETRKDGPAGTGTIDKRTPRAMTRGYWVCTTLYKNSCRVSTKRYSDSVQPNTPTTYRLEPYWKPLSRQFPALVVNPVFRPVA